MKRLTELFLVFARISAFTLGGGLAMLPLVEREITEKRRWLDKQEFLDVLVVANSMPGVMILNVATTVGYKTAGLPGAACAAAGTVLPPFAAIIAIAWFMFGMQGNAVVNRVFSGLRPAIIALIIVPVISLSRAARLKSGLAISGLVVIALLAGVSPVPIIFAALAVAAVFAFIPSK